MPYYILWIRSHQEDWTSDFLSIKQSSFVPQTNKLDDKWATEYLSDIPLIERNGIQQNLSRNKSINWASEFEIFDVDRNTDSYQSIKHGDLQNWSEEFLDGIYVKIFLEYKLNYLARQVLLNNYTSIVANIPHMITQVR